MEIAVIIPAYNEEKTIANVLDVVRNVEIIDEIIVVSDGSIDHTAEIASSFGVKVVILHENIGKGGAMREGLKHTDADIILFLDADLIGLNENHIRDLVDPLLKNEAEMSVGIFDRGRMATDLAQKIVPCLSGQRAVRRSILLGVEDLDITRFGVEVALTRHVEIKGIRVKEVPLNDLTHVMKEEKLGLIRGFSARLKMYWEIAAYMKRYAKKG